MSRAPTFVRDLYGLVASGAERVVSMTELVDVSIRCEGVSPLLMNKIPERVLLQLIDKDPTKKRAKAAAETLTPRKMAEEHVHTTKAGDPIIPTNALLAALIEAGKYVRLDGKRQVSTTTSTVLPGLLTISDPFLPLLLPDASTAAPWEVDVRPGRNPNGGELVVLVRPRFDAWCFDVHAIIDTAQISESAVRGLFDIAGMRVGLLDFRPARKGNCGQFKIVRWERQAAKAAE